MFLLGAFLAGSAMGYAADRTFTTDRGSGRPYTERSMRDELQQKLKLTAAQRAILDSAYDWRRSRFDEIMNPIRIQMDAVRDTTRQRVLASLDSAQRATYQAIIDDMRKKADSGRRGPGGPR